MMKNINNNKISKMSEVNKMITMVDMNINIMMISQNNPNIKIKNINKLILMIYLIKELENNFLQIQQINKQQI